MENVLTVLLAGGKGSRLEPLTRDRAKPAVPFGGMCQPPRRPSKTGHHGGGEYRISELRSLDRG